MYDLKVRHTTLRTLTNSFTLGLAIITYGFDNEKLRASRHKNKSHSRYATRAIPVYRICVKIGARIWSAKQ